jgi:hypothetical protein
LFIEEIPFIIKRKAGFVIQSYKPVKPIIVGRSGNSYVSMVPVIIKVNATEQDARAGFDMERY